MEALYKFVLVVFLIAIILWFILCIEAIILGFINWVLGFFGTSLSEVFESLKMAVEEELDLIRRKKK